ncbi:MAG: hypothetical protein ACREIV_03870, partial [Planctomycetaceae bacterium]
VLLAFVLAGCGSSESENDDDARKQPPAESGPAADVAVRTAIAGLRNDRPEALWEFLPPSYRRDVNGVVRTFALHVDEELWTAAVELLRRLAELMQTRQEDILSYPLLANNERADVAALAAQWDDVAGLLRVVAHSGLSDLERLKTFDGGEFLAGDGGEMIRQFRAVSQVVNQTDPFALLDGAEVELVESSGETASVRITTPDGQSRAHRFVRVEGHWVPEAWATDWDQSIAERKLEIETLLHPNVVAQRKPEVLALLNQANTVAENLAATQTREEFHSVLTLQFLPLALSAGSRLRPEAPATNEPPAPLSPEDEGRTPAAERTVTVLVPNVTSRDAQERLTVQLLDRVDDLDSSAALPSVEGDTLRIQLSPVADVAAFARRIDFATVTAIDVERREITLEVKVP